MTKEEKDTLWDIIDEVEQLKMSCEDSNDFECMMQESDLINPEKYPASAAYHNTSLMHLILIERHEQEFKRIEGIFERLQQLHKCVKAE